MLETQTDISKEQDSWAKPSNIPSWPAQEEEASPDEILAVALTNLEMDRPEVADRLLTMAVMEGHGDHRLWLAAGVSRLRQGLVPQAASAFRMSSWLSGDPEAIALLNLCDEIGV